MTLVLEFCDREVTALVDKYATLLHLPTDQLYVTTSRSAYGAVLGRAVPSAYGGAYCFIRRRNIHAILINTERIDRTKPRALDVVIAEELIHMRDWLDGDRRRHAKHGYDRIAHKVAALTGANLEEIRSALIPVTRRPYKYVYECPGCGVRIPRRRQGLWSCARCSPRFDRRYLLRIVEQVE